MKRPESLLDHPNARLRVPMCRKIVVLPVVIALTLAAITVLAAALPTSHAQATTYVLAYCEEPAPEPGPSIARPRVALSGKDLNGEDLAPGDEILWTITVKNLGDTLTNIVITDVVPEWTSYVGGSIGGSGANDGGSPKLSWNVGTLGCGDKVTVSFVSRVDDGVPEGTLIKNQASADSAQTPPGTSKVVTLKVGESPASSKGETVVDPGAKEAGSEEEVLASAINVVNDLLRKMFLRLEAEGLHSLD